MVFFNSYIYFEVDRMAESLAKRIGRTSQALALLVSGSVRPLHPGETPYVVGSEEEAGFILSRNTLYKDLLRLVLRIDATTAIFRVGKNRFSVHTLQGVIYVEGGIMSNVGFGTLPHSTGLTIYNNQGFPIQQFTNVGNPKIQG